MTTALVTTFNEADTIGSFVAALRPYVDTVLVVDDRRSTDNTEQIAAEAGAHTLVDTSITGIGPCLLAGFARCRGEKVVVIDAGGSHDPDQIPELAQTAKDTHAGVVVGSRFVTGSTYRGRHIRRRASHLYSWACSVKTGHSVKDWTSGYRWYSPSAIGALLSRPPKARMHGFQPESLAYILDAGFTVREHPIHYRAGRSSMNRKVACEAIGVLRCL